MPNKEESTGNDAVLNNVRDDFRRAPESQGHHYPMHLEGHGSLGHTKDDGHFLHRVALWQQSEYLLPRLG